MTDLKLLVLGEKKIVNAFMLLGSLGFTVSLPEDGESAIQYLETNKDGIGGILLTDNVHQNYPKLIKKINQSDIPWVVLPGDQEQNSGYQELENLAEKAIGMKLNFN